MAGKTYSPGRTMAAMEALVAVAVTSMVVLATSQVE
tara:strand:- start:360 stop:467 length:108 start_codon:yes stop_codon:yes gene_type:complete